MTKLKKFAKWTGFSAVSLAVSAPAFSADMSETLNTVISEAQSNYQVVILGLIALAAIGFGARLIVSAMKA